MENTIQLNYEKKKGEKMYKIKENMDKVECMYLAEKITSTHEEVGDPFWIENAQAVLASAIHEGSKENMSLDQVVNFLMKDDPEKVMEKLWESGHNLTKTLIIPLYGVSERTIQGIFQVLRSMLTENKKLPRSAN